MSVDADILDSGAGPGRAWLVAGVLALGVGLASQLVDGSSQLPTAPGEARAAERATPAHHPSAAPAGHWRGRIIITGKARRAILQEPVLRAPRDIPRTADSTMRWMNPSYRYSVTAHAFHDNVPDPPG